ncbi:MAG TPA: hypothetical protein VHD32_02885 [Candidatus Didemnitutus sp.]|nr:hypothetical protein [Candidatus Didemnitutus sp.]
MAGTRARGSIERKLLFYPSHRPDPGELPTWRDGAEVIGVCRPVKSPRTVWLFCHGNAGQASDRSYALSCFSPDDGVYFLEYPDYGSRPGTPSAASFNAAARAAYARLRADFPGVPVGVVGESIGSGAACLLAGSTQPPDKIVLVVPFDQLSAVARDHYPRWLVRWLLVDDWNNVAALAGFRGPVDIFGAERDQVIPVGHARALAAAHPTAHFTLIPGGHNEWSEGGRVMIRMP